MEFIREKIKEKPISKRKIAIKVGISALCGLVFALVVCVVLLIAVPFILPQKGTENTEELGTSEDIQQEEDSQGTEDQNVGLIIPPDFNLSISDYETLQKELYQIGNQANRAMVTVIKTENKDDWVVNDYKTESSGAGIIIYEDNNYVYILTEKKLIEDAPHIRVVFVDGTGAEATLFKYDGNTGISILTIEKRML